MERKDRTEAHRMTEGKYSSVFFFLLSSFCFCFFIVLSLVLVRGLEPCKLVPRSLVTKAKKLSCGYGLRNFNS